MSPGEWHKPQVNPEAQASKDPLVAQAFAAHTPGPWRMRIDSGTAVQAGDVDVACTLDGHGRVDFKTQQANRKLLAAAPSLLAAVARATAEWCEDGDLCDDTVKQLMAAERRAKGGA